MFNTRTKRVVFATGVLFVLSLAIFGSLIAVAWMSMNNTMAVSADGFAYDFAAEEEVILASRLGNDAPVLHSRLGNDVPMLDSRIGNDVPVLHSRIGSDVPVLHSRIGSGIVSSIDYRDYVLRIDYKEYVRSMEYKNTISESGSTGSGRTSDYSNLWFMIRLTH